MATQAATFPPGPKWSYPGQHFLAMRRNPLEFLSQTARECGDIAHFKLGPAHIFLLNHPDLIRDVLVAHHANFHKGRGLQRAKRMLGEGLLTSEGEFHLRQRRLAQPAFHPQRVAAYAGTMTQSAERVCANWRDGATLEIADEMKRLALIIAALTLFDADVEAEAKDIGQALTSAMELFNLGTIMVPFLSFLEKLPLPGTRRFKLARARLDETIYRLIRERRAEGKDHGDLLSMLMFAQDTDSRLKTQDSMSDEQLRDECMTIFLAGHETTANAMTWTWYLLSQNPDVETRLQSELKDVLGGRVPTAADVGKLQYTEMVFAEAMRLYPPAWILGRRALNEYAIGPYTAPKDSIILLSQFVMHRDERYYPEPLKFDPLRWTPEARAQRPKFSYFPFGGGPRVCIGEQFAWMEGVLLIATIAQKWRLKLAPGHRVEPQPLVTLRAKYGMKMLVERR